MYYRPFHFIFPKEIKDGKVFSFPMRVCSVCTFGFLTSQLVPWMLLRHCSPAARTVALLFSNYSSVYSKMMQRKKSSSVFRNLFIFLYGYFSCMYVFAPLEWLETVSGPLVLELQKVVSLLVDAGNRTQAL